MKQYRDTLFRHLDGIAITTTVDTLKQEGVLDYLLEVGSVSLDDIAQHYKFNKAYLNVALRALASQSWLDYTVDGDRVMVSTNAISTEAFRLAGLYTDVAELIYLSGNYHPRKFDVEPFRLMMQIVERYKQDYGLSDEAKRNPIANQILKHIEGVLVGPSVVILGMGGMFQKYFMSTRFSADEYHHHPELFEQLLDFFAWLGWFEKLDGLYKFTEMGLFYAKRASAYGVTVSYLPTFRQVPKLITGSKSKRATHRKGIKEEHVDRAMNVWGSGGAHSTYFKYIDEILIDLFNQPIEQQPKGILDVGCGNGAFLIHCFDLIDRQTLRGTLLEEHPLFLVGADYNAEALTITRKNLINAQVWAKLMWGDIGDPDTIAHEIKEHYGVQLSDLLNVRTFLDHNRSWTEPSHLDNVEALPNTTGAFAYQGQCLHGTAVLSNLKQHYQAWAPYINQHGLITLELHTISPELASQNIGSCAATAYDLTHGYSDQYLVEIASHNAILAACGLSNAPQYHRTFPSRDYATVSLNYIK